MILTYGSKFADAWPGIDVEQLKSLWSEELGAYSRTEIARGVTGLKTRAWPPTLPEFLMLCRPPIEPGTAYAEACSKFTRWSDGEAVEWSRPEIFWAAKTIGLWDFRNIPYRQLEARWKQALDDAPNTEPLAPLKKIAATSAAYADPVVRERVAQGLRDLAAKMVRRPQVALPTRNAELEAVHRAFEAELDAREQKVR